MDAFFFQKDNPDYYYPALKTHLRVTIIHPTVGKFVTEQRKQRKYIMTLETINILCLPLFSPDKQCHLDGRKIEE